MCICVIIYLKICFLNIVLLLRTTKNAIYGQQNYILSHLILSYHKTFSVFFFLFLFFCLTETLSHLLDQVWDDDLASMVEGLATGCEFKHSTNPHWGENLMATSSEFAEQIN